MMGPLVEAAVPSELQPLRLWGSAVNVGLKLHLKASGRRAGLVSVYGSVPTNKRRKARIGFPCAMSAVRLTAQGSLEEP